MGKSFGRYSRSRGGREHAQETIQLPPSTCQIHQQRPFSLAESSRLPRSEWELLHSATLSVASIGLAPCPSSPLPARLTGGGKPARGAAAAIPLLCSSSSPPPKALLAATLKCVVEIRVAFVRSFSWAPANICPGNRLNALYEFCVCGAFPRLASFFLPFLLPLVATTGSAAYPSHSAVRSLARSTFVPPRATMRLSIGLLEHTRFGLIRSYRRRGGASCSRLGTGVVGSRSE